MLTNKGPEKSKAALPDSFHTQPLCPPWDAPPPYMLGGNTSSSSHQVLRLKGLFIAKAAKMKRGEPEPEW